MKRNTIKKALISVMTVGALSLCACFGAFAENVNADVTTKLPQSLNIGDTVSYQDNSLSVSGLEEYAGYTFSVLTDGDALQAPEDGGMGGGDDTITTVSSDGSAELYLFGGYVAVKEGTFSIQPYVLKRPDGYNEAWVYGINELETDLLEEAFNAETGLNISIDDISPDDPNFERLQSWVNEHEAEYYEMAKNRCIKVGEPITVTVKANEGDDISLKANIEVRKAALKKLAEEKTYNKSEYTAESYKTYSVALEKVKQVLNNPDATVEEIENAQSELNKAISDLKPTPVASSSTSSETNATSPKTGDNFSVIAIVLLLASIIGIAFSAKKIIKLS